MSSAANNAGGDGEDEVRVVCVWMAWIALQRLSADCTGALYAMVRRLGHTITDTPLISQHTYSLTHPPTQPKQAWKKTLVKPKADNRVQTEVRLFALRM